MNQNLIASSPGVVGNIGNCSTQMITVTTGRSSLWRIEKQDIATNSCTGQVVNTN